MSKKLLFIAVAIFLFSQNSFSQTLLNGTVTDVIDGRTLVVETTPGKTFNLKLRYLEVPETKQPLSDVVKNHLKNLALGKTIFISKMRLFDTYTLGVGEVNKVDLSQQLLRDGAGWFDINDADTSGDENTNVYKKLESLAKEEKLGVWGIKGMKTAWEFRAEKDEKIPKAITQTEVTETVLAKEKNLGEASLADSVKIASEPYKKSNVLQNSSKMTIFDFPFPVTSSSIAQSAVATNNQPQTPTDKSSPNQFSKDLNQVYLAQFNKGSVSTKLYEIEYQVGKAKQKIALIFVYDYSLDDSNKNVTKLGLMVLSQYNISPFLKGKNVSLILDNNKKVNLGVAKYYPNKKVEAIIFENMEQSDILQIPQSETLTVAIGKYQKAVSSSYKQTIDGFVNTLK